MVTVGGFARLYYSYSYTAIAPHLHVMTKYVHESRVLPKMRMAHQIEQQFIECIFEIIFILVKIMDELLPITLVLSSTRLVTSRWEDWEVLVVVMLFSFSINVRGAMVVFLRCTSRRRRRGRTTQRFKECVVIAGNYERRNYKALPYRRTQFPLYLSHFV